MPGRDRALPSPRCVRRVRLGPAQSPEALVGGLPHQGLQPEPDGIGVGPRPHCRLCVTEQLLIDVEGLLHTDKITIHSGSAPGGCGICIQGWVWNRIVSTRSVATGVP